MKGKPNRLFEARIRNFDQLIEGKKVLPAGLHHGIKGAICDAAADAQFLAFELISGAAPSR